MAEPATTAKDSRERRNLGAVIAAVAVSWLTLLLVLWGPAGGEQRPVAEMIFATTSTPKATPTPTKTPTRTPTPAATPVPAHVVLLGGNDNNGNLLASAEIFSPSQNTFSPITGGVGFGRASTTATLLTSLQVLVAGGMGAGGIPLSSAEVYVPNVGEFSPTGSLNQARGGHVAVPLLNGMVLVAGGCCVPFNVLDPFWKSAEIFNPNLHAFSLTKGSMTTARFGAAGALLANGKVLIVGGVSDGAEAMPATCDIFNPATGKFTATAGPMISGLLEPTATALLGNKQVLIAGGIAKVGQTYAAQAGAQLFDQQSGGFFPVFPMVNARSSHTATLLRNGRVLIVGGCCDSKGHALATAEIFNPSIGYFTLTGKLNVPRQEHTATLLPNGNVLIAGGSNASAAALKSAESTTLPAANSPCSSAK